MTVVWRGEEIKSITSSSLATSGSLSLSLSWSREEAMIACPPSKTLLPRMTASSLSSHVSFSCSCSSITCNASFTAILALPLPLPLPLPLLPLGSPFFLLPPERMVPFLAESLSLSLLPWLLLLRADDFPLTPLRFIPLALALALALPLALELFSSLAAWRRFRFSS